jgi:uncharacterized protein YndB with AHSA1/START domain
MEITRELVLPAPADEVWEALTDPDRLAEWFANDVELDLRTGGVGVFRWDNGEMRTAVVEEVDPPHRFGFRWTDADEAESAVLFELDELSEGTKVIVRETSCEFSAALDLRLLLGARAAA